MKKILSQTHCSFIATFLLTSFYTLASAANSDIKLLSEVINGQSAVQAINLNPRLAQAKVGKRIGLTLPNQASLTFEVSAVQQVYQGSKVIQAMSSDGVSLLLTMDDKGSFGSISGNGLNYSIGDTHESGQVLIDQNSESFSEIDLSDDERIPPHLSADQAGYLQMGYTPTLMEQRVAKQNSTVTILVLYSNEFANGFTSPTARVNQMIAFTNQAFDRSGVNIELKLAHAQAFEFNNNTNIGTLLSQITDGVGNFSSVESIRTRYGADMVALLPFRNGSGSAGVAWINGGDPRYSYSVTQMSPNCCDFVFAHELGHNLGSGHERVSANPSQASPCNFNFTGYACGHGNASNNWGTIMSYLNSRRVNHVFSNPSLRCLGEPCGVPRGRANQADNKSSFNITGPLVAAFRADPVAAGDKIVPPLLDLLLDDD